MRMPGYGNEIRNVELIYRARKRLAKSVGEKVRKNRIFKQAAARKRLKSIIPIDGHIPDDLILEILYRLPPNSLTECSCVSKTWFNTICRNHKFATTHLRQSQKKNKMSLSFHFSRDRPPEDLIPMEGGIYYLEKDEVDLKRSFRYLSYQRPLGSGYCNGLYCRPFGLNSIWVCNPSRDEIFHVFPPSIRGYDADYRIVTCFGFGFDSWSNRYKLVFVAQTIGGGDYQCFVFTFGDSCWRQVNISIDTVGLWSWEKSALFCNGVLYWRGATEPYPLIISFDLHLESFHLIRAPAECISADDKQQHLLEYKGALCVARLEKQSPIAAAGVDIGSQNYYKLHLHTLRDRIKQVWIKETPVGLPFPLPSLDTTRVLGFADDRILFHWLDGKDFQLRDMQMKYVKVVLPPAPHVEYSVNNHMENALSLRTFLPAKALRLDNVDLRSIEVSLCQRPRGFALFVLITDSLFKVGRETYMVD